MNFETNEINAAEAPVPDGVIDLVESAPRAADLENHEASPDFESMEPLALYEGEQPEEYLMRTYEFLLDDAEREGKAVGLVKGLNLVEMNPKYQTFYGRTLAHLQDAQENEHYKAATLIKFDDERNKAEFEKIRSSLTFSRNYGKIDEDGAVTYDHTNQDRNFFGRAKGIDNIPYAQSLFSVASQTPEALAYIKRELDGKSILLLGGGHSAEDLIFGTYSLSESLPIIPKSVVNADPYIKSEKIDKGRAHPYSSVSIRADDAEIMKAELQERGLGPFDEMWASFSVPYYLNTPQEIEGMFDTITANLAEGGIARIFPFSIGEEDDSMDCYEEVMSQIQNLMKSQDFNVYMTHNAAGATLYVRKIK